MSYVAPGQVTQAILWTIHPDGSRSILDILELEATPERAVNMLRDYLPWFDLFCGQPATLRRGYVTDAGTFYMPSSARPLPLFGR